MSELSNQWAALRDDSKLQDGYIKIRITEVGQMPVYAGLKKPGNWPALLLLVPNHAIPTKVQYPESQGFEFGPIAGEAGRDGTTWLVLTAVDGRFQDIFTILADDCYLALLKAESPEKGVTIFIDRLYHWQAFLNRHGHRGLTRQQQQGLFGELYFLKNHLMTNLEMHNALSSWTGPSGTVQDFHFQNTCLEVKTTIQRKHKKFRVSDVRQLDDTTWDKLFLHVIALEPREEHPDTLPALIANLREALSEQGMLQDLFTQLLQEVGYLDEHAERYLGAGFEVLDEYFFQVHGDFPRMKEFDVPAGVTEVQYSVELAACQDYLIDGGRLMSHIKEQNT